MKKATLSTAIVVSMMALSGTAIATGNQNSNSTNNGGNSQSGTSTQQQAQTSNQGSDSQLQAQTTNQTQTTAQTQSSSQSQNQEQSQNMVGSPSPSGKADQNQNQSQIGVEKAEQRRSSVANAVQTMLQLADRANGIGEQVRVIAQNQDKEQDKLEARLQNAESRGAVAKFFMGPDYGQIKETRAILSQNRDRIRQLTELTNQITNEGDQSVLREQIRLLEQANLDTELAIEKAESGFSLFGWLFRWFS